MNPTTLFRLAFLVPMTAATVSCAGLWRFEPLNGDQGDDGGAAGDGASNNAGLNDADLPDSPYFGFIDMYSWVGADGGLTNSVSAEFLPTYNMGCASLVDCMLTGFCSDPIVGGCCHTGGGYSGESIGAGSITISDGTSDSVLLQEVIEQGSSGQASAGYPGQVSFPWNPGDTIRVAAAGDAVPAFTGSVLGPEPLANVSPDFAGALKSSPVNVPTSTPLVVSWTPGSSGGAVVFQFGNVACAADDSAGQLTVPVMFLETVAYWPQVSMDRVALTTLVTPIADVGIAARAGFVGSAAPAQ